MKYLLDGQIKPLPEGYISKEKDNIVEIITSEEFNRIHSDAEYYHIIKQSISCIQYCKADVLANAITGTFYIPPNDEPDGKAKAFGFFIREKKLVFIDDDNNIEPLLSHIQSINVFEKTAIAHLLFEIMEHFIKDDVLILQEYENQLEVLEEKILKNDDEDFTQSLMQKRKDLLILWTYYNQLMDLSEDLKENINGVFSESDTRLFELFYTRVERLMNNTVVLQEFTVQLRELYLANVQIKQNKVMQFLAIITAIFLPLTLIAGWYGMNFINMPELKVRSAYFFVIGISILVVVGEIIYFKKKKW